MRSSLSRRSRMESMFCSISGLVSLMNASSMSTRFWFAKRIWLESSENTRIYLIRVFSSTSAASSRICARLSSDISRRSSASSAVFNRSRFRRNQMKSTTNWESSRPWTTISSSFRIQSFVRFSRIAWNRSRNTLLSTAPRTSSTCSYVSVSPKWNAAHWSRRLRASRMEPSPAFAT